jgi:uncharacterized membrane protein YedE/YeeE
VAAVPAEGGLVKMMVAGLVTGVLFGYLLQGARVLRYDKQLGALRLRDMTIVKFMLSSILVAMIGIYLLKDLNLIELKVKTTILGANLVGGLVFGVGWALLGYCPGTQLGALGEGRWDALWGVVGMVLGAIAFAEVYPFLQRTVLTWGDLGKVTLPGVLGINHWFVIPVLGIGFIALFGFFEKKGL